MKRNLHHALCFFLCALLMFIKPIAAIGAELNYSVAKHVQVHLPSKAHILINAQNSMVLSEHNATLKLPPASLTKLMTLYIAFNYLKQGRLNEKMPVYTSENASRAHGATSFLAPNSNHPLSTVLLAIAVASGNDASVALAEHISGSESAFVQLMNQTAKTLGMHNTQFANASGLPHKQHRSTAEDLALLAQRILKEHPERMPLFQSKEFAYKGFKQHNRNRLLWTRPHSTGMKTGHTEEAGFCIIASEDQNGVPILAVTLGSQSEQQRQIAASNLLDIAQSSFKHLTLDNTQALPIRPIRTWQATQTTITPELQKPLELSIPSGPKVTTRAKQLTQLQAPMQKGSIVGELIVSVDGKDIAKTPLVLGQDVEQSHFFYRIIDTIRHFF